MAMHRLIEAGLADDRFPLYGDGRQVRDFTFVDDVVRANQLAAEQDAPPGSVLDIAGGTQTTLAEVVEIVGELIGGSVVVDRRPPQPGDVARTGGSVESARGMLGWTPRVDLREGLTLQVAWHESRRVRAGSPAR
jgi:UDP-glucuronate 4-epimerase